MSTLTLTASNGTTFTFRRIEPGMSYGRSAVNDRSGPLVEVYDAAYSFTPWGQVICQYDVRTLETHTPGVGLILDGGIPVWRVDGASMDQVRAWLAHA